MWHNEYDPTMEENKVKLFGETTRGTLCETFMTENQCPGLVEAKRIDDEPGLKGWWMSPALLGQANLGKTSCPRSSRIFLPGADLVPMVIFTEELNFDPTIRDSVKKHGGQVATNFFMAPSSAIGDYRPTQMILQALSINFAASKEGILCVYDWRNDLILYSNSKRSTATAANTATAARMGWSSWGWYYP